MRQSTRVNIVSAREAAEMIGNGSTIGLTGAGGGLLEPDHIYQAIEARFLETGAPNNIAIVHALGFGDRKRKGLNRFAHEGLTKRVIGGHWGWTPTMQQLAVDEKIEAYSLPAGIISSLYREIGAGRPGVISHVGLGTFVDPRLQGGACNASASEPLVKILELDGREYLHYKAFPIDVAIITGSYADEFGNISLEDEPVDLDTYSLAMAARNSGGIVIAQVREIVRRGSIDPRKVTVPALMVDAVVVNPDQQQTYRSRYEPAVSGQKRALFPGVTTAGTSDVKHLIAARASRELMDGAVINFGFGTATTLAAQLSEQNRLDDYRITIEHGIHGGHMVDGDLFGVTVNPDALLNMNEQFDFYSGGGLELAIMGMAELDGHGNVNVSHLGGRVNGPGGFIDIVQNVKKLVFCGSFDAKGTQLEIGDGRLAIKTHGSLSKLRENVERITFSGHYSRLSGQDVIYITERAVFRLVEDGVELVEIAPGVDLQADILDRMGFAPIVRNPVLMDATLFQSRVSESA